MEGSSYLANQTGLNPQRKARKERREEWKAGQSYLLYSQGKTKQRKVEVSSHPLHSDTKVDYTIVQPLQ